MRKIGIFGGSFNPIHNGHIYLAGAAADKLALDKVIFVVSNIPPHKDGSEYAPNKCRLEMCRLAASCSAEFEVSEYELSKDSVSYTIYTVEHFSKKYPNNELYFIIGSDSFLDFDKWYKYEEILKKVILVVIPRDTAEDNSGMFLQKMDKLSKVNEIIHLNIQTMDVSSTEIRKKIKNHENFACYLDKNVVKYILTNNLYQ